MIFNSLLWSLYKVFLTKCSLRFLSSLRSNSRAVISALSVVQAAGEKNISWNESNKMSCQNKNRGREELMETSLFRKFFIFTE